MYRLILTSESHIVQRQQRLLKLISFSLKDKHHIRHLKEVLKYDGTGATKEDMLKIEEEWCFHHYLVQSSLNHVSEMCMLPNSIFQTHNSSSFSSSFLVIHSCS